MRKYIGIVTLAMALALALSGCGKQVGPDSNAGPEYGVAMNVVAVSNGTDTFYDDLLSVNEGEVSSLKNDMIGTEFTFKNITDNSVTIIVNCPGALIEQTEYLLDNGRSISINVSKDSFNNVYTFETVNYFKLGVE